ncbi:hypothetical protein GCM10022281_15140 [Sphingomonas rosea]|uniref:Uncharacterized protein n=1 Tax=Sphingomonas rosea TaxID=335605 RepID=A0ABP7U488_9SPHN
MASFDVVNYSLRPSKSIQRQLVFEGVKKLQAQLDLDRLVYVGFGSIWFTDFVLAHKLLGVDDMVSIESNEVGYRRAVFNSPYATVRVRHGFSSAVLPSLYEDEIVRGRPWLVWLDYDKEFNADLKEDVVALVENAPTNSILLVTFNGNEMKYDKAPERPEHLKRLFGSVVPDDLPTRACKDDRMQETLADFSLQMMQSVAADLARPGGFVPAFRLIYRDVAPMVTVGGVLPARGAARIASEVVRAADWPCRPQKPIVAPHLTVREAASLQSRLPCVGRLERADVQALGFDLEDDQLEAFQAYYRHYPAYAQIVA